MKKLLALFLILTMLVPMCPGVSAQEEEKIIPFTMVNWAGVNAQWGLDNVIGMPMFWTSGKYKPEKWTVQYGGSTNISEIAELLKRAFDKVPEGARYINFMGLGQAIRLYAEEIVFLDGSEKQIYDWMTEFLEKYHAIGGKLDGIILDIEYLEMFYYFFNVHYAEKDLLLMNRIVEDPRYQEVIRPLLAERGFRFWENVSDYTPEIYSINRKTGTHNEQLIWDCVMQELLSGVVNRAVCEPMLKYYPDAVVSDYKVKDEHTWYTGGENVGANTTKAGNCSNDNMYFGKPGEDFYAAYNTPTGYNDAYYPCTAFYQALSEIVSARNMYFSTDTHRLNVWFAGYDYTGIIGDNGIAGTGGTNPTKPACGTAYYTEIMFHIGLLNPEPFIGWIAEESYPDPADLERVYRVVSDALHKLTELVGMADRKPIVLPGNIYNRKFILSGMYAGGRNVWRLTPDVDLVSLEDFRVQGDDPTFCVNGQTITFPGGRIIPESQVAEIGTCGYWIETAADVYPVIATDEDRFEEFPAFKADFEQFALGTFDYLTCAPSKAWDMAWQGGTPAQIVAVEDGKALEFTGDYSVSLIDLPQNVTAGDQYAKQQSWEARLTIPEMSEDGEIYVLKYNDKRAFVEDSGFLITGGKLYYDKEGESVELCDLPAGTYRFVRHMNLSDLDAPRSSYFVYDAAGKELAKALDIPTLGIGTKVYSVGFTSVEADGKVLLDDFVLRVLGVNADLFLYDAKFGSQVTDITQRQTRDTAYRLSWMNAARTEATAEVIASVYEGDTLVSETVVQTVVMQPGCDDVATGIVEVKEGQSVVVSLKTSGGEEPEPEPDPSEPDTTDPDTTDPDTSTPDTPDTTSPDGSILPGKSGPSTTVLILVIAVIVCAAAAITTVLVLKKKGKMNA